MPRSGAGIYSLPPGTLAVPFSEIASDKYNAFANDLVTDLNDARPIVAGGTGATTLDEARANLGIGGPVPVEFFGVVGDNTADDTAGVTAALQYDGHVDWGNGIYRITTPISVTRTSALRWTSYGARIRYDGTTAQRAVEIQTAGYSVWLSGVLTFDAGLKAFDAVYFENGTAFVTPFVAEDLRAVNAYRASTAFTGGNGIWIRGNFHPVTLDRPRVSNILMATGAGVSGSQGVAGITVSANTYAPGTVTIRDADIDTVKSEDTTYTDDQDGIRIFALADGAATLPYETRARIVGGKIKNTPGRAVKSQVEDTVVDSVQIVLTTGFTAASVPIIGPHPAIDFQVGGGTVTNCTYIYDDYAHSCLAQFGGTLDTAASGKNVAGGTISGIKVYLENTPQMDRLVKFSPQLSDDFTVTVDDIQVISSTALVNKIIGGSTSGSTGDEILNVYGVRGMFATALVEAVSSGTVHLRIEGCTNLGTAVPLITGAATVGTLHTSGNRGVNEVGIQQRVTDAGTSTGLTIQYATSTQGMKFAVDDRATLGLQFFSTTYPITVSGGAGDGITFKVDNGATTALTLDVNGIAIFSNPIDLASYAKASLPSAANASRLIFVTDDVGGSTPAFSDGTNWRRVADRAVIS